jgi:hypothetical protein
VFDALGGDRARHLLEFHDETQMFVALFVRNVVRALEQESRTNSNTRTLRRVPPAAAATARLM